MVEAARIALARYADPAVAAADGYHVNGLAVIDFHASNPTYEHDDRVLDPAHPEICGRCVSNIAGPGEDRHWF